MMWEKKNAKIFEVTFESTNKSEKDIEYGISLCRAILTSLGIWPIQPRNTIFKIITFIQLIVVYSLLLFSLILGFLHIFLEVYDHTKQFKLIAPLISYVSSTFKYSILLSKKKKILACLNDVIMDWRSVRYSEDRDIMLRNAKSGRFLAWVALILMCTVSFSFRIVLQLFNRRQARINNITARTLPIPVYRPLLTVDTSPSYEIAWLIQLSASFIMSDVTIGEISLVVLLMRHACGQFGILINRINKLIEKYELGTKQDENEIGQLVELHMKVLSFSGRVENLMNKVCLIEFGGSTMNICFSGYNLLEAIQRHDIISALIWNILLVAWIFSIFILCYSSEQLIQKNREIGYTVYMIDWHKLPIKDARNLILVLAMSNYPCRLTGGNVVELSYISFSFVMRTSLGYLNLLRTFSV